MASKKKNQKKKQLLWDSHRHGWTVTGKEKKKGKRRERKTNEWYSPRKKPVINYKRRDADGLNRLSLGKAAGSKEK